jgi:gas vesicle protein
MTVADPSRTIRMSNELKEELKNDLKEELKEDHKEELKENIQKQLKNIRRTQIKNSIRQFNELRKELNKLQNETKEIIF